jgi:hypothetical protein
MNAFNDFARMRFSSCIYSEASTTNKSRLGCGFRHILILKSSGTNWKSEDFVSFTTWRTAAAFKVS